MYADILKLNDILDLLLIQKAFINK